MNTGDALLQIQAFVVTHPGATFDLTVDKWFAIAAILTLWAYMTLAPGRAHARS